MYSDPSGFAAVDDSLCRHKNGGEKDSKGDSSSIVEIVDKEKGVFIFEIKNEYCSIKDAERIVFMVLGAVKTMRFL